MNIHFKRLTVFKEQFDFVSTKFQDVDVEKDCKPTRNIIDMVPILYSKSTVIVNLKNVNEDFDDNPTLTSQY